MILSIAPGAYDQRREQTFRDELARAMARFYTQGDDVEVPPGARLILTSPNGTRYSVVVDNAGNLSTVAA